MKSKLFRKHASVIPTGAPTLRSGQAAWSGGIPSFRRFLATLGMTALFYWSATAQNSNGVSVTDLNVVAGTVTFNVSWNDEHPDDFLWSDSVWVFVDYNNGAGKMERLLLSSAKLTASSWPAASVTFGKDGNNKGAWVVGNAKTSAAGSFSATVQLLTATADLAGVCVYASNYPPVGEYITPTQLAFTGTPNYTLVLTHANGSTYSAMSDGAFHVPPGDTLKTFTDKTGAPGTFYCIPPVAPTVAKGEFCYEQSGVLVATASGSAAIVWYDAPSAGNLLHTGNMLSLTPYNNTAQYYAQAALSENCRSERTKADYTVSNCTISGDCPNYTAGNVGSNTVPAACAAHYAGQIGAAAISLSCMAHDAGRIGN